MPQYNYFLFRHSDIGYFSEHSGVCYRCAGEETGVCRFTEPVTELTGNDRGSDKAEKIHPYKEKSTKFA
jgi:hypothetical protein